MDESGSQRHSLERLHRWEKLGFGMFIHFGMSTFEEKELPAGDAPCSRYKPEGLDVDQWISVARDAGMKYAVLTAKHVAGHCLWPSDQTDYHVGNSPVKTDVVDAFVRACEKRGIVPGLYYCSWDNHHKFGSLTPSDLKVIPPEERNHGPLWWTQVFTSSRYQAFQSAQLEELCTRYGDLGEIWIDIPSVLPRAFRADLYDSIARWQPNAVVMMNNGIGDGSKLKFESVWPSDLVAIERSMPNSHGGHKPWRLVEGRHYYLPGEVCEPIGLEWFYVDSDVPRSDAELLGIHLVARSRGANLLLDFGPDKKGLIPERFVNASLRLRKNIDRLVL